MNCVISALERNWYISPPWKQQMPLLEVHLSEKVYVTTHHAFGYCCGVHLQNNEWVYVVNCECSIIHVTKHQIVGTGRVQSTYLKKPTFVLGDRVMLRCLPHGTKQRLIVGIQLVNNSWCYAVEMMSPTLSQTLNTPNRFALVKEQDLIRVLL
ncbi:DUF1392 family protein [Nostoc sp. TCL26-01]|uniref:DUF1392 family protein n=1 Tax=Nostoc sp. TCL26-01 TaxID=2576904 RepID=UPI0015BF9636|nr:DUF1392 family protein [Nostoc sp. TCL26-01]QLE59625.1 DUF1392 domain-containing protein [Nostoc sp. TCL26-01]